MRWSSGRTIEQLADALRKRGARIFENTEVRRFGVSNTKEERRYFVESDVTSEGHEYRYLISALPLPIFRRLVEGVGEKTLCDFDKIEYFGVSSLVLVLDSPLSDIYWLNVADPELTFGIYIEHTNFVPKENYGGQTIIYLASYLEQTHPYLEMTVDEIMGEHIPSLRKIFLDFSEKYIREAHHFTAKWATPVYDLGYSKKIPLPFLKESGIGLASTAHIYPRDRNMNNSVSVGRAAAQAILSQTLAQS